MLSIALFLSGKTARWTVDVDGGEDFDDNDRNDDDYYGDSDDDVTGILILIT